MNKQALLEKKYNSALQGELEKIALSGKTLASFARKKAINTNRLKDSVRDSFVGVKKPGFSAALLNSERGVINNAITKSKGSNINPIRSEAIRQAGNSRKQILKNNKFF